MTAAESRYYRASRTARRAWEATQPQLALEGLTAGDGAGIESYYGSRRPTAPAVSPSGLDDGPLTAETVHARSIPPRERRTGAIIEPEGGFTSGAGLDVDVPDRPSHHTSEASLNTTMGVDANSPEGTSVHPQNGD